MQQTDSWPCQTAAQASGLELRLDFLKVAQHLLFQISRNTGMIDLSMSHLSRPHSSAAQRWRFATLESLVLRQRESGHKSRCHPPRHNNNNNNSSSSSSKGQCQRRHSSRIFHRDRKCHRISTGHRTNRGHRVARVRRGSRGHRGHRHRLALLVP